MSRLATAAILTVLLTAASGAAQTPAGTPDLGTSAFETYIELLRQQSGIPGISVALIQDGTVLLERGLGMANQEARIRATPDTPYLIADITQTFAATLILQCVESRRLDLDAPASRYGVAVPDGAVTLREILTHAAPGTPSGFKYDPARFALLTRAVEACTGRPYRAEVASRLMDALAMIDSVPGRDLEDPSAVPEGMYDADDLSRYAAVLQRLAVPYRVDNRKRSTRTEVPVDGINAAAGIVSTVRDLARLDAALDAGLLRPETLAEAWAPAAGPSGLPLPFGLGWFTQTYRGTPIVWHYGFVPNAYSALIVKVPSRKVTMILLANSDGLVVPSQLEGGDVTRSLFASVFLRMLL